MCASLRAIVRLPLLGVVRQNKEHVGEHDAYVGLTGRAVNMHRIPYMTVFGDFLAKKTVYTPYIYGSGQPYAYLMRNV
jgi:hypothetical protein